MERYKILWQIGDGSYGSVWKAVNRQTSEVVAIKRMKRKFYSWEECMSLREVRSLRKLSHPHVVKLREIIRENNELYFVFEYLEHNLYQVMKQRQGRPFSEAQVQKWTYQILQGLNHMHMHGFFHRDMKPENLLVIGENVIKIADLGLARETASLPPYTEYVSTRWYRAPEVLLRKADYSAPVDLFAMGAIMAELFTLKPLFPGSTEIDQIFKICSVVGTFTAETWPEGHRLSQQMGFQLHPLPAKPLSKFVPQASPAALDLMTSLCQWDPARRPTAAQALQHPFFKGMCAIPHSVTPLRERTNTASSSLQPAGAIQGFNPGPFNPGPFNPGYPSPAPARSQAFPSASVSQSVDWTPMRSSMRAAVSVEKQRRRIGTTRAAAEQALVTSWPPHSMQPPQPQLGQPPPDLWVNARSVAAARQQGFSQMERGATLWHGAWAAPLQVTAASKLLFPEMPGPCSPSAPRNLIPAHRKAPVGAHHASSRSRKGFKPCRDGLAAGRGRGSGAGCLQASTPASVPRKKLAPDLGRLLGSAMPDAKLGDFGPMSASLRRAAAAAGGQPMSGL